nr:MAG TPA: hypothetical protein [Caudoviricetes sp.]
MYALNGVSNFGRFLRTSMVFSPLIIFSHHLGLMLISTALAKAEHFLLAAHHRPLIA